MRRFQQTGRALGSEVALTLIAKDIATANKLFIDLWAAIKAFENQFSRFLPDSELTRFNKQAGQPTVVSASFRRLLQTCQKFSTLTDGLYNPFILPDLQRAGYLASWPQPNASTNQDYRQRQTASSGQLIITGQTATIPADSALDLGGIGKGYLLDQLAASLNKQKVNAYWLSLGGDIIGKGNDINGQPWEVAVANARQPQQSVGSLQLAKTGGAIATSGTTKRQGTKAGQPWHHIIDPRTGRPAKTDLLTVSIQAASATEADVFAKCLVIIGSPKAQQFIKQHALQAVIMQTEKGDILR